ncbi:hypothetical protein QAD02_020659 [Eretmocerus hayati]|uniref:Uncharacterized protein n=1 Tax=Eretmocerus hayati TaxID=131215 RepID=A0ACC2PPY1_9HYME|nr:hypothetical protein QAD02_020659 [Eretmocerus hayati]
MTANAFYTNTAGVSAATPYVQSACETVEPAYPNAPRVSAAAPCAQDASSIAITQYMQSAGETVKPACTYTSGASSATLYVPSASVTAAGYTNTVESQEAEYVYSNGTTTTGRVTYASVDLTPIDSSQRYGNSKILTAHETPIFINWEQATTALQEKKTPEEKLKSHDHANKSSEGDGDDFRNSMKRDLKTALSSMEEKQPGSDPKRKKSSKGIPRVERKKQEATKLIFNRALKPTTETKYEICMAHKYGNSSFAWINCAKCNKNPADPTCIKKTPYICISAYFS